MTKPWTAWGVRWESKNAIDGVQRYLIGSCGVPPIPLMFETKRECLEYIKANYGYIRTRKDLRDEPHGWRVPKAIRIEVTVKDLDAN